VDQKISLKNFSARKISLGDSPLGQAIRSLWFIGQERCDRRAVTTAMAFLSADEVTEMTSSAHLMPGWLTRLVRHANGWQPQTIL